MARFLYSMPKSGLGRQSFWTKLISEEVRKQYNNLIRQLLETKAANEPLTLSMKVTKVIQRLYEDTKTRLDGNLANIMDWGGKYVGAILRIASLLHIAENPGFPEFSEVSWQIMKNVVTIGKYFLEHAKAAYSFMGDDPVNKQSEYLLNAIKRNQLQKCMEQTAIAIGGMLFELTELPVMPI